MKKMLTIIAVLGLAVLMAGCGKKEAATAPSIQDIKDQAAKAGADATPVVDAAKKDAGAAVDAAKKDAGAAVDSVKKDAAKKVDEATEPK